MATTSWLLKSIGLFCKRTLLKRLYSAKETYDSKEPTDRSHPVGEFVKLVFAFVWQQTRLSLPGGLMIWGECFKPLTPNHQSSVSFAKEPYKRDCILQKRPMILRSRGLGLRAYARS